MLKQRKATPATVVVGLAVTAGALAAFGKIAADLDRPDPNDRAVTLTSTWLAVVEKDVQPTKIHWEVGPAGAVRTSGDDATNANHWQRLVHAKVGERVAFFVAVHDGRLPSSAIHLGPVQLATGSTSCVLPAVPA